MTIRASRVLDASLPYELFQRAVGAQEVRRRLVADFIQPRPGDRILDVGCGPADILDALPQGTAYVGFDTNETYIRTAKARWQARGRFFVARAGDPPPGELDGSFDIVLAIGVLHHLDDGEAAQLCSTVPKWLRGGGAFVTFDPVFHPEQNPIGRWLAAHDRGEHVRTSDGYLALAASNFGTVESTLRTDLLRVPYSHFIMKAIAQPVEES